MSQNNTLGEYLRARRELVRPEDVGLPVNGVRRVAGLRREEVALLAGISSDYYLRLEQGRDRNMLAGQNRLMCMFLDPAERAFYIDWEQSLGP